MDADERLCLDYNQASELIRALMDVRFKLIAVVPTIAAAAVAILGSRRSPAELLAVGLVGLTATIGILVYDLRNTQFLDAVIRHAQALERMLDMHTVRGTSGSGGVFSLFAPWHGRLFGMAPGGQSRAIGLVYGAALGGWSYLVAWGALRALDFSAAREVGGVLGALAGVAVIVEMERVGREAEAANRTATDGS